MFFDREAQITEGDGEQIPDDDTTFMCAVSRVPGGQETARGQAYDAEGVVEEAAAEYLVSIPNRRLVVDGVRYSVVDAVHHEVLPHVQVALSELRPAG